MHAEGYITSTFNYAIRDMVAADIPAVVDYYNDLHRLEGVEEGTSLAEFTDCYHAPANHAKYVVARLLDDAGGERRAIGVMEYTGLRGAGRFRGKFDVHPSYRLAGVGRALYAEFERSVKEAGVGHLYVVPNIKATLLVEFLERRGFTVERYFWMLRLDSDQPVPEAVLPEGITVRTFVPGQDVELYAYIRNATFAELYGFVPRTVEELAHRTSEQHFRPEGLFFSYDGDEVVGFSLATVDPREGERLGYSLGRLQSVGVMPSHRRRGLGRALLLLGMNYLRRHSSVIDLSMEGKNTKALALYESVGFRQQKGWANMEKRLGGSGAAQSK